MDLSWLNIQMPKVQPSKAKRKKNEQLVFDSFEMNLDIITGFLDR